LLKCFSGKYLKKLMGDTDVEDSLKKLDKLTQEEALMASAELLKMTDRLGSQVMGVDDRVRGVGSRVQEVGDHVGNKVQDVDGRVQGIGKEITNRVEGVGDKVQDVGDKVQDVGDKVDDRMLDIDHKLDQANRLSSRSAAPHSGASYPSRGPAP
jgi:uncharacterized protein YoxC